MLKTKLISMVYNGHLNEVGSDNVMLVWFFYNHIMKCKVQHKIQWMTRLKKEDNIHQVIVVFTVL